MQIKNTCVKMMPDSSCRTIPSRSIVLEGGIEGKRGSVYQSSKEVQKMKNIVTVRESEKIQLSRTTHFFRSADSLYCLDDEHNPKGSSVRPVNSNLNSTPVSKALRGSCSSGSFIEIDPTLDKREKVCDETAERDLIEDLRFRCEQVVGPLNYGNELLDQKSSIILCKSLYAKLDMPHSPSPSECEFSSRESSKTRFSPIRKMLDPFMKSKSLRSPLGSGMEPGDTNPRGMESMRRNRTFRKSLIPDFSCTAKNSEVEAPLVKDDNHFPMAVSPVRLHGCLKSMSKHGVPFFEFSLNCPEEVLVAKTWKADSASNWVYTIHSVFSRKRSNVGGRGSNDSTKELSVVGQMQVSCYLCSELKDGGDSDDSMVTEFVLYDIEHARKIQGRSECPSEDAIEPHIHPSLLVSHELNDKSSAAKVKHQVNTSDGCQFDSSISYPFAPAILRPNLETAAIVIQVPFEKRESLKYKRGDTSDKVHPNLLNLTTGDQKSSYISDCKASEMMKVVIPSGNHGLPSVESKGPSSLLDRWRLGGGCDCGGWEMGCPVVILGNPVIQCANDQPLLDNQRPLEIFVQGSKESTPALSMKVVEEKGEYTVDFHAKLSTLQAFSICLALLHGTETYAAAGLDKGNNLPRCNLQKVLFEEEMKFLVESVPKKENKKVSKMVQEIPRSYVPNPPFSPIARV